MGGNFAEREKAIPYTLELGLVTWDRALMRGRVRVFKIE